MESKIEKLPHSRIKFSIKANPSDLTHAAEHAVSHLTAHVTVKGFRPGKAPKPMLIQSVGRGHILSELVDHALPEFLQQAAKEHDITIIETPSYALEKLCELNDDGTVKPDTSLEFTAEADYAPTVEVGDYHTLSVSLAKIEAVTDATVDGTLQQLVDRRAQFIPVERAAKKGDRIEIDFAGKRNGIPEDRLASKHHPIILGSNTMIPGFEDELIGKKTGQAHTFEITFPKDYHAKDLVGEKVLFDVKIHGVAEKRLPEINDALAKDFGQKSINDLKKAIRQEREFFSANKAKEANEAAVLDAFLPLVELELPKSLVEREIDRQLEVMREQASGYGLSFDNYLKHIKKTEEELREEIRPTAEKAVTIGLGLGEVVKREDLEKTANPGVAAIARLVEIATTAEKKSSKS